MGDCGKLAKVSGNYALIISHNPDTGKTCVKLPSGCKKLILSINVLSLVVLIELDILTNHF